jgi:hypothetical protein
MSGVWGDGAINGRREQMNEQTGNNLSDADKQTIAMWVLALNAGNSMPLVWRAKRLNDGPLGLMMQPDYVASLAAWNK